jgi:hypothetical protein
VERRRAGNRALVFDWLPLKVAGIVEEMSSEPASNPSRIYMIEVRDSKGCSEPSYSTDPRTYGLLDDLSDADYDACKHQLKAFLNRDDAIAFACHGNMVSIVCPVFDRVGDKWEYNEVETSRMADSLS